MIENMKIWMTAFAVWLGNGFSCTGSHHLKLKGSKFKAKWYFLSSHSPPLFNRNAMNGCIGWKLFIRSPWRRMTTYFVSTTKRASARTGKINFTCKAWEMCCLAGKVQSGGLQGWLIERRIQNVLVASDYFFFPKCFLALSQKPLKWKAEFQNDLNNRKQKKTLQSLLQKNPDALSSLRQKHIYTILRFVNYLLLFWKKIQILTIENNFDILSYLLIFFDKLHLLYIYYIYIVLLFLSGAFYLFGSLLCHLWHLRQSSGIKRKGGGVAEGQKKSKQQAYLNWPEHLRRLSVPHHDARADACGCLPWT